MIDDATPARVLAVYAHPDDAEVSCGGTLARWARAGAEVHVVVCCQGDKGAAPADVGPDELAGIRRQEAVAAGQVLGVHDHRWLGVPDGEVENCESRRMQVIEIIREVTPDAVIAPDPTAVFFGDTYVNHRDHREVGWLVIDAVAAAASPRYHPAGGPPHTISSLYLSGTLEGDTWVDVSDTIDTKAEAISFHASQLGDTTEWLRTAVRQRAEQGGRQAGVAFAEGFRRLRFA